MAALPQLLEEDIDVLDRCLQELLTRSEASAAFVLDKAGFIITRQGDVEQMDITTLAALAANSFAATQAIAQLIHEPNFNSIYQQGDNYSLWTTHIDESSLLLTLFQSNTSLGVIKFYANRAIPTLAQQMAVAQQRSPSHSIDLASLNLADASEVFKRKSP